MTRPCDLEAAEREIATLREELEETNRGLVALAMELEDRVDERTAQLRERAEQQAAVARLGQAALASQQIDEVVALATRVATHTLKVDTAVFLGVDPEGGALSVRGAHGIPENRAGYPAPGWTAEQLDALQRQPEMIFRALVAPPPGLVPDCAAVIVPGRDRPAGLLAVRSTLPRAFDDDDVIFLEATANVLASALTRQADQGELAAQLREIELSNAELQQFAFVVSHDLKAPLHTIGGFAELLSLSFEGQLGDDGDRYITGIRAGIDRMARLINDLLEYSRVGSQRDLTRPVPCEHAVRLALANLEGDLGSSGGQVVCSDLPTVRADATQLTQLFQNLVGNAIKFRSEDPPCVEIAAIERDDAWELSVSDNGIGIDLAQQQQAFQIFRRLHGSDRYPGTGVGLAICKKIVELHGGRIWIEARDRGTSFHFTLPKA